MTALPRAPGFNPWQQALYGLSSGLMAAGAPGGFQNFGAGVGQGIGQFQDQRSRLVREQILQKQLERDEADAAAEQARRDAEQKRLEALRSSAGGLLKTYDDTDTANDAFGQLSPAQLSLARLQLESNPEGLLNTLGDWTKTEKPKTTDDLTEYEFYKSQGGTENFTDWMRANRKSGASTSSSIVNMGPTGINYGDPPKGTAWARDPSDPMKVILDERGVPIALPIQGTPEFLEQQKASEAATTKKTAQQQTTDIVTTDINRALEQMDSAILPTTGIGGAALKGIPSTAAHNVSELIATVRANASIDKLQQMRAMSPTGGALGNVTEQENKMLADTIGSLEQSQTDEQVRYNLQRVYNTYLDIVHGKGQGPARYELKAPPGPEGKAPDADQNPYKDMSDEELLKLLGIPAAPQ